MKAAIVREGTLALEPDWEDPVAGEGEVLIELRASSVNGADHYMSLGKYPAAGGKVPPIQRPGLEFSGVVVSVGSDVEAFTAGDRVIGLTDSGAHQELIVADARIIAPLPADVSWEAGGSISEIFTAAHDALITQGGLAAGERLLVTGASGGVGTAAIQIARHVGADVDAVVRNPALHGPILDLGAERVMSEVDPNAEDRYDVILELVTGEHMTSHLRSLRPDGRIVVIGCAAGPRTEFNLLRLMAKRGRISGSTLRSRPLEMKARAFQSMIADLGSAFSDGSLTIPIHSRHRFDDIIEAYESFARSGKYGKVVIWREAGDA